MHFITSLAFAAVAGVVSAAPVENTAKTVALPLTQVNNVKDMKNIVGRGQARIEKVNKIQSASTGSSFASSGTVTNEDVSYLAPVSIGGDTWQLIVDTGCKLR